jgi:hypothetical protein
MVSSGDLIILTAPSFSPGRPSASMPGKSAFLTSPTCVEFNAVVETSRSKACSPVSYQLSRSWFRNGTHGESLKVCNPRLLPRKHPDQSIRRPSCDISVPEARNSPH